MHDAGGPDATLFQLVSSQALQSLLDRIVGPKTLVLSPSLAGPLGLITEVGLLKVSFEKSRGASSTAETAQVSRLVTSRITTEQPWRHKDVLARTWSIVAS